MEDVTRLPKAWFEDGGGFFGRYYIEGDNSIEGYLRNPMTLEERTQREIDGVVKLLDLRAGDRVLDCPCGYGRHSPELGSRGFDGVGCDIEVLARRTVTRLVPLGAFRSLAIHCVRGA